MDWLKSLTNGSVGEGALAGLGAPGGVPDLARVVGDIVTKIDQNNRLLGQLIKALQDLSPTATGSFTMSAAASKVVSNAAVATSSFVMLWPMNAAAGTLVGAGVYWTAATGNFTVATSSGSAAAGTEVFAWASWTSL